MLNNNFIVKSTKRLFYNFLFVLFIQLKSTDRRQILRIFYKLHSMGNTIINNFKMLSHTNFRRTYVFGGCHHWSTYSKSYKTNSDPIKYVIIPKGYMSDFCAINGETKDQVRIWMILSQTHCHHAKLCFRHPHYVYFSDNMQYFSNIVISPSTSNC